ncbi:MAG TPA: indolepyruvate ferredoxin oxidoreductase family protein, partial [Novosphingobium sp.]|nr:indolepyruvate ferredoxin oxidoreductase family protein [Novosphingobium sp.]
ALTREDTQVLANEDVAPTGEFQTNRNLDLSASRFLSAIGKRVRADGIASLRAGALAQRLLGDTIFTNLMMVGFAAQKGLLPVGLAAIEEAIRLNGVAAKANLAALALGRLAAASAEDLFDLADAPAHAPALPHTYAELVESRARLLEAWQDAAWAADYRAFLSGIEARLAARGITQADALLAEAARGLGKLMAYKDEYEVARLYSAPEFRARLADQFAGNPRLKVHLTSPPGCAGYGPSTPHLRARLAPPLLAFRKDAKTGRPRKIAFGSWIFPVFRLLARGKGLRGTVFDPFGYTAERRMERALIGEYRALISHLAERVTPATMTTAIELAAATDLVVGFGPVKEAGVAAFRERVAQLRAMLEAEDQTQGTGARQTEPA